jgi:class 3 adenylate cyclase/tetratricopeptide (TPR) repeat protein
VTTPTREVRKIVTAVFCDVVGSTTLGERLDPEVLRRVLGEYFAVMREVAESHGGQVAKFIGDAVLAVFGLPQLHEDDALRAVRTADEMRARLEALNVSLRARWNVELETRMGVCTGEVVSGADDDVVLGDVMNTAARLEQQAGPGEILVADQTYALVRDAVVADPLELGVKGKSAPLRAWRLLRVDPGAAGHRRRFDRPLVGRERELRLLEEVLGRALEQRGLQLVTLIGEPGIGKSRLLAEFEHNLERRGERVTCLRGQCLAYGDGIGFWPVAEIVKQHLSITQTTSEHDARMRLAAAVDGMQDAPWLRARLAPLVGLPGEAGEREEVFTAWQRFFDEIADRTPLVLVFEDLHWADPALFAFLEYLVEWSADAPLLVLCTARAELLDTQPGWAGGATNATRLALRPLDEGEMGRLAETLLGELVPASGAIAALVARCGGNPLYAEEYARIVADRIPGAESDLAIPATVRALIGARIDGLPVAGRALLHDAAVVGKVFWAGALAAIGEHDPARVRTDLHELTRKELLHRSRTTTVPGDEEYSFWHDLVHEVAYTQIPRARRAEAHRRTAEWIEDMAGDRIDDRAELLAHHYSTALELTRESRDGDTEPLRKAALRHLGAAARHALELDAAHAAQLARQGLTLADTSETAPLLHLLGSSLVLSGALEEARACLAEARAAAETIGDTETLSMTYYQEYELAFFTGDTQGADQLVEAAVARLSDEPASGSFAMLLSSAAFLRLMHMDLGPSSELIERAIEMGEAVGEPQAVAAAINFRGLLRIESGNPDALGDLEASLAMFEEVGSTLITMAKFHLGYGRLHMRGPADARSAFEDAIATGTRTRNTLYEMWARVEDIGRLADSGAWDELLEAVDRVLAWADANGSRQHSASVAPHKARVRALRGDTTAARIAMGDALEHAQNIGYPQALVPALASAALIDYLDRDAARARELLETIEPARLSCQSPMAEICRILVACGGSHHAQTLLGHVGDGPTRLVNNVASGRAALTEAAGDHAAAEPLYDDAAIRWRTYGNPYELAHALAGRARCLIALGRAETATAPREEAASIFGRLGVRDPLAPAQAAI